MSESDRHEKGLARFREVFGRDPRPGNNPDFIKITVDHLFGEIWTRPHLELRERSLITLSALAMAKADWELRGHVGAALNLGISRETILETMMHVAYYGGWPVGLHGLQIAQAVFEEQDAKSKKATEP